MAAKRSLLLVAALAVTTVGCDNRASQRWPTPDEEPYAWMPDERSRAIIEKRWAEGSTVTLGLAGDEESIREVVLAHLNAGNTQTVEEIRWLSADEVVVEASWYTGPLASAGYFYVLQRVEGKWSIVTRYMLYIS